MSKLFSWSYLITFACKLPLLHNSLLWTKLDESCFHTMLLRLHSETSFLCVPGAVGKCDCGGRMCPEPGQMGNGGQRGGSGWLRGPCLDLWCGRGNNTYIMSTRTSHSQKFGWIISICTHSQIHRQIKQFANFKSLILFYREDVMQKLVVSLF